MRGALFFIFLFALLLRGYEHVQAGKLLNTSCHLAEQEMKKSQKGKPGEQDSIATYGSHSEDVYFVCEEPQDVNNNQQLARNYKLLTRDDIVLSRTFFLNYLYGCFHDRLPLCSHLPCKYITQRALRI